MTILLIELTAFDPTEPGDRVVRVATERYIDPSAPGPFRDCILERSRIRREIFADGQAFGAAAMDYGRLLLANLTGWLDWIVANDAATDGRALVLSLLASAAAPYSSRQPVLTGRAGQVLVGIKEAEVRVQDDFASALDQPIQKERFAGDNALPDGVEGIEDLKDRWVPVLYGPALGFSPPFVNTVKLIACVADRAVQAITVTAVDDQGAPITAGTQRASLAALLANIPTANTYDWFLGSASERAYICFGSTPVGAVTVSATTGASAADRTAAQLFKRILVERAGVDEASINADDLADLDAANDAELGFWAGTDEMTVRAALDLIAGSVGAGYWQDAAGVWRIRRIEAPSSTPVARFAVLGLGRPGATDEGNILELEPLFTGRADGGLPVHRVTVRYARNHTVQNADALAGVALDRKARLTVEWYERKAENSAVKTKHPSAAELTVDTAFADEAAAAAEATRRLGLFGVTRRRYRLKVALTPAIAAAVDLGAVVRVEHPRFGLAAGKLFVVTALELDLLTLTAELTIWG